MTTHIRSRNPDPRCKRGDRWLVQPLAALALELARRHPDTLVHIWTDSPATIVTDVTRASIIAAVDHVRRVSRVHRAGDFVVADPSKGVGDAVDHWEALP